MNSNAPITPDKIGIGATPNRSTGDPLQSMRSLARLLDDIVRVPGTNISIGLDPLLNLIPFAGDAIGTLMSVSLLITAVRMNVPKRVLARMIVNIGIDALIGVIPAIGQVLDFVWKANSKNMALLERYAVMPEATKKASSVALIVVLMVVLAIVCGTLVSAYWLLKLLAFALNIPLW